MVTETLTLTFHKLFYMSNSNMIGSKLLSYFQQQKSFISAHLEFPALPLAAAFLAPPLSQAPIGW